MDLHLKLVNVSDFSGREVMIWANVIEGAPSSWMLLKLPVDGMLNQFDIMGYAVPKFGPAELILTFHPGGKEKLQKVLNALQGMETISLELRREPKTDWRVKPKNG